MHGEIDNPMIDERFDPKQIDHDPYVECECEVRVKFHMKMLRDECNGRYLPPDDPDFGFYVCDDGPIEKAIEILQEGRGGYRVEYDT